MCERLADQYDGQKKAVDISSAFRSTTMDIIATFCFAECMDTLDWKEFRHPLLVSVEASLPIFWVFKHFPPVRWMVLNCPPWLSVILNPNSAGILQVREV